MLQKREVLSMGFTKGMGPFGGCINFVFQKYIDIYIHMNPFLWKRYQKQLYLLKTCLVMSHCLTMYQYIYLNIWIDSSNPVGSSNVTGKGGSKYGVHQGNGTIWRMYHFCFFRYIFLHTYESLLVKEISKTTLSIYWNRVLSCLIVSLCINICIYIYIYIFFDRFK